MNFRTLSNRLSALNEKLADVAVGFDNGTITFRNAALRLDDVGFKFADLMTPFFTDFPQSKATKILRAAFTQIDRALDKVDDGAITPNNAYDLIENAYVAIEKADDLIYDFVPRKK